MGIGRRTVLIALDGGKEDLDRIVSARFGHKLVQYEGVGRVLLLLFHWLEEGVEYGTYRSPSELVHAVGGTDRSWAVIGWKDLNGEKRLQGMCRC